MTNIIYIIFDFFYNFRIFISESRIELGDLRGVITGYLDKAVLLTRTGRIRLTMSFNNEVKPTSVLKFTRTFVYLNSGARCIR